MEFVLYQFLSRLFDMGREHTPLIRHGLSHINTYDVTEDELDRIEREGSDLGTDFHFALFFITLGLSFLTSVVLTEIKSRVILDTFVGMTLAGFSFGLVLGVKWWKLRGAFSNTIRKIRERQVGPVGEQDKELKPSDLAELPSSEPTKAPPGASL